MRPHRPDRMRLVDHQQRLVPSLHLDELGKVRVVPVHAVHPLHNDQHPAVLVTNFRQ